MPTRKKVKTFPTKSFFDDENFYFSLSHPLFLKHSFSLKNFQKKLCKTKKKGFWPQQEQQIRHCFHLGHSPPPGDPIGELNAPEVTSAQMLRAMMAYIWPKDDAMIRSR